MKKYIYNTLILLFLSQYCFGQDIRFQLLVSWPDLTNALKNRVELAQSLTEILSKSTKVDKKLIQDTNDASEEFNKALNLSYSLDSLLVRKFEEMDYNVSLALTRLLVGLEEDPSFKKREDVQEKLTQLESVENRIVTEKKRHNEICRSGKSYDLMFRMKSKKAPIVKF